MVLALIVPVGILAFHCRIGNAAPLSYFDLCLGDHFTIPHGIHSRILTWAWSIRVTTATGVPPPTNQWIAHTVRLNREVGVVQLCVAATVVVAVANTILALRIEDVALDSW